MPVSLNLHNKSNIPEPEGYENVANIAPSEIKEAESKQSPSQTSLPRGREDARIHEEAMPRFQKITIGYKQSASFKTHAATQDVDHFISAVTSSQKIFDKWVKMNAEFTQNQIELERHEARIKEGQEKRKDDFLQGMKEVQEMKKHIMAYYEFLAENKEV